MCSLLSLCFQTRLHEAGPRWRNAHHKKSSTKGRSDNWVRYWVPHIADTGSQGTHSACITLNAKAKLRTNTWKLNTRICDCFGQTRQLFFLRKLILIIILNDLKCNWAQTIDYHGSTIDYDSFSYSLQLFLFNDSMPSLWVWYFT